LRRSILLQALGTRGRRMLDNFRLWYLRNQNEITWFLIGFLIASAISSFSRGEYADMLFSLLLACANYYLNKR